MLLGTAASLSSQISWFTKSDWGSCKGTTGWDGVALGTRDEKNNWAYSGWPEPRCIQRHTNRDVL
jgi:hypothetical protein